ncbi:hydroxylysine kinase [Phymastichus coffea]|uniref:hydroxylysine kinase n=1 Tax=Phymastichus coffea TaxID=108790 RepID=UPI00273B6A2A|nr:hydroxylysine kinase [Phymastichus coffea]
MTEGILLKPGQQIKAIMNQNDARRFVELRYGLVVESIKELDSYDDRNYRILCKDTSINNNPYVSSIAKNGYILKVINSLDSKKTSFIEAQNELLIFLSKKGIICTIPVKQKDGSYYSLEILNGSSEKHVVRLLTYCEGEILQDVPKTAELLKNVGSFTARLDNILKEFWHPAYDTQTSLWVMPAVPKIRDFLFVMDDKSDINIIEEIVSNFEQKVLTIIDTLEKGIIHGDLNENNIVISSDNKDVGAIIDFGDSHKNCFIFELAISLCYMITQSKDIEMAKYVIQGYQEVRQLTLQEKRILKLCVCARLAQSLVLGSYSYQREPENDYLIRQHPMKWLTLKKLWPMDDNKVMKMWSI